MTGETASRYRVLEKLGGGGMGVVYKAEDVKLGRIVALKFLSPDLSDEPVAKERFVREASAASALDHPGICTIYDIGESSDGRLFIAMQYCEGETLKQRISRGALHDEEAIRLAAQVGRALAAAHRRGIVHRDIKPANIIVSSSGEAKLVDFGIARLVRDLSPTAETGLGTPAYMPPSIATADPQTDLYALGVVLFEMLTGERPYGCEPMSHYRSGLPERVQLVVARLLRCEGREPYATSGCRGRGPRGHTGLGCLPRGRDDDSGNDRRDGPPPRVRPLRLQRPSGSSSIPLHHRRVIDREREGAPTAERRSSTPSYCIGLRVRHSAAAPPRTVIKRRF